MNTRELPQGHKILPLRGNVLWLRPETGEITQEKGKFFRVSTGPGGVGIGEKGSSTIPKWCKTCWPNPSIIWSRSGLTAYGHIGETLESVQHFNKKEGYYVIDGYYCRQCNTFYQAGE